MTTIVVVEAKGGVEALFAYERLNTSMYKLSADKRRKADEIYFAYDPVFGSSVRTVKDGVSCLYAARADGNRQVMQGHHHYGMYLKNLFTLKAIDKATLDRNMKKHDQLLARRQTESELSDVMATLAQAKVVLSKKQKAQLDAYVARRAKDEDA